MSFSKDLKKIDHRSWESIKIKWMDYLPQYIEVGQIPLHEIAELEITEELNRKTQIGNGEYKENVPNLRSEIFREGIYLFHKASHVCNAGLVHVENNIYTWGLSSAYHSSFFSLKSLLCILGLSFPKMKSNSKCLLIDCFPEEEKLSKNQIKKGILPIQEMKFVQFPNLQHHQYWEIFLRVLRVSNIPLWNNDLIEFLLSIGSTDFAYQRNSIHYKNNCWIIPEDLFNQVEKEDFALFGDYFELVKKSNQEKDDFSFAISFLILYMTYILIKDISISTSILNEEFNLIKSCLNKSNNNRILNVFNFD